MFGEYAQVASYINQDGTQNRGGERGNSSYLPSYLLPMYQSTNPWQTGHDMSHDDFIIIAEFSEIEGPKPLMTIPRDGGSEFDKNAFSVKIMAVDHQTSTSGFSLSEDTQVILTDSGEFNVSAFVHHFALYDNEARGFVRPFCMAYVTTDQRYFKYGNKMVFVKDLEQHSSDLEYTKNCLIVNYRKAASDESITSPTDDRKYQDLNNIQTTLEEIRDILVILKPLLNDKRLENRFYTLEKRAWHDWNRPNKSDTMSLQENWFTDHTGTATAHYGSFHEKNENPLHLFDREKVYIPKLVETKRKKKFDRTLRSLHELCSWGAKEGMKKLRSIYEHFKRDGMILEIESNESCLLDSPSSVLSIGQCVTHNFLSNLSLRPADCSYLDINSKPIDITQRWSSLDTLESSMESFKSVVSLDSLRSAQSSDSFIIATDRFSDEDEMSRQKSVPRTDSNFSISSSHTDTDTVPSVYESFPNSPVKTADKTFLPGEISSTEDRKSSLSDSKSDTSKGFSENEDSGIHSENQNSIHSISVEESISENIQNNSIQTDNIRDEIKGSELSRVPSTSSQLSESSERLDGIINIGNSSGKIDVLDRSLSRQYSEPDDNTDTTHSSTDGIRCTFSPLLRKPRSGVYTLGDLLFNLRPGSPGIGIIHVLNKYSNLQFIINSILTGRIVLVIGTIKEELEVIKLVTALSLFLPQHRRKHNCILEWSSKPLRISDLSRIKLAGVCKSDKRSVDSNVKKYCTIIDVEKRVILAPNYQGVLINNIISKKKCFKTDADFIAYTHCWLMDIASKVFIFYHSFCLGSTKLLINSSTISSYKQQYCNSVKGFLTKLGIHDNDSPIIEYLTEVVKLIQLNITPNEDGSRVLPVALSYKPCQLYRC
ncbi:hypothetical protein LOTGIDRAFT_232675 [Lottia gigantea]|uniref:UDENN FLCN/SMCR8-type domain-containing protein n=1 Tax=Lottia gigantea TaxID=225164 RepID=V4A8Y2_LOTGI|nr:hypothetical protein LOTGIDRAFT_232675 [Lottia gigantea]ESO93217.1 hypothetical protein LOTGIDRAFT_232675 [Lottia gigantea]